MKVKVCEYKKGQEMRPGWMVLCIGFLPLFAMAQLPPLQIENNIQFIEGGVGLSESYAIRAESSRWPVKLSFSKSKGQKSEWVSNVLLTIQDSKGVQVFSHQVDGPMILINLKPGRYFIQSVYKGESKTADLNLVSSEITSINIRF